MNINSESVKLINPYELLGFDSKNPNIDMKSLKSTYYTLSLICHPDKGGSIEDMLVLQNAYLYIKSQIELKDSKSQDFKTVEAEFNEFIKQQSQNPPPFSKVYEEAHIWLQEFNYKFNGTYKFKANKKNETETETETQNQENIDEHNINYNINVFDGYGDMMENSYSELTYRMDVNDIEKLRNNDINTIVKQNFNNNITTYKEPLTYNSFASTSELSLTNKKCNDYTTKVGSTFLCDYKEAFTNNDNSHIKLETVCINKDNLNNDDLIKDYERALLDRDMFENNCRLANLELVDQNKNTQLLFDNITK